MLTLPYLSCRLRLFKTPAVLVVDKSPSNLCSTTLELNVRPLQARCIPLGSSFR